MKSSPLSPSPVTGAVAAVTAWNIDATRKKCNIQVMLQLDSTTQPTAINPPNLTLETAQGGWQRMFIRTQTVFAPHISLIYLDGIQLLAFFLFHHHFWLILVNFLICILTRLTCPTSSFWRMVPPNGCSGNISERSRSIFLTLGISP